MTALVWILITKNEMTGLYLSLDAAVAESLTYHCELCL
jgi:hypothetical protein